MVSNPDVRFAAGAIDALAGAGAAVAGPALFWDDAHQWLLPPAELHTRAEVLDRTLASRWRGWAVRRDRRRVRARIAFWRLARTTRVRAISGAVMAIRAKAFDEAGGFDQRYRLYFEENDFLRRFLCRNRLIIHGFQERLHKLLGLGVLGQLFERVHGEVGPAGARRVGPVFLFNDDALSIGRAPNCFARQLGAVGQLERVCHR